MPEYEKEQTTKHHSSADTNLGTIMYEIGRGGQGYVAKTDKDQALKVLSFKNADGTVNKQALKEVTMNIALKKAADDHKELNNPLIIMDKWNLTDTPVTDEDKGRNLVFSMPLHNLTKLEVFDFDESDNEQDKNSYISSLNELLPALKKLNELGFRPDDTNFFADTTTQEILLADYDQFSIYLESQASQYITDAYDEVLTELKARNTGINIFPDLKDVIPSKNNRTSYSNLKESDIVYIQNTQDLLGMVDLSLSSSFNTGFLSPSTSRLPYSEQVDSLLSSVNHYVENSKQPPTQDADPNKQLADILKGQQIDSPNVTKAPDNAKEAPTNTPNTKGKSLPDSTLSKS